MQILERIEEIYPKLTKKQKQIADYMKDHAEDMAFITLKELSTEVGITEITVLNMCKALGYESFNEVKYEFRKYINASRVTFYQENDYYNTKVPDYELTEKEKLLVDICREERGLIEELARNFDSRRMLEVAQLFFEYPKIVLCGRGISYLICECIATYLSEAQIPTMKVNTELNESVYSALPMLDKKTLVVAISFPDYYFVTQKMAEFAKKKKAKVLCITDSKESNIAWIADEVLTVSSTTRMALNTLSAPMALANLLASAVKIASEQRQRKGHVEGFDKLF
ncbi:MurR/RpiR family transcriptional regulator [Hespellia stercorisuis]|uniref:Transcriptional regulator, RpiR family n=1 Tax=Hespellia stercorisuis DSM 15480 TaxID=1121950 RepID=A0A1M6KLR5_9FIRM|nr:MurR/RpiR family transcriptional regulator [Hespellia stercorisuis]SHJ59913.1 transcriptional regulator, RpiR family [Hespellia stercorisuis DSM 15480]